MIFKANVFLLYTVDNVNTVLINYIMNSAFQISLVGWKGLKKEICYFT